MAPYIAALVILIVAILFAVYKRVDGFDILNNVNPNDLYDAVARRTTRDASGNPVDASGNSARPSASTSGNSAPVTTPAFTKELEDRIAKSIASQLKDSLLSQRAIDSSIQDTSCPYASYQSNAVSQGQEYTHAKPSPTPDMSEYIRKDSIPCWNCSLP
jgi:hypothetical protein